MGIFRNPPCTSPLPLRNAIWFRRPRHFPLADAQPAPSPNTGGFGKPRTFRRLVFASAQSRFAPFAFRSIAPSNRPGPEPAPCMAPLGQCQCKASPAAPVNVIETAHPTSSAGAFAASPLPRTTTKTIDITDAQVIRPGLRESRPRCACAAPDLAAVLLAARNSWKAGVKTISAATYPLPRKVLASRPDRSARS